MYLDFIGLLQNPDSKYFVVPLVTAILSIAAKAMSRNDQVVMKRRVEYFYLAPNLLVSNFVFICCEFPKYTLITCEAQRTAFNNTCINALIFNFWMTMAITFFIRTYGWDKERKELRAGRGIWGPDVAALFVMYMVFNTIKL